MNEGANPPIFRRKGFSYAVANAPNQNFANKKKLISISQCHYGSIQWEWPSCVTLEIIKGRHFESLELLDAEVPK